MSLPLLPEPIFHYYNWQTESSLPSYSADQMREYGQQYYEQGKADAIEHLKAAGHWAAVDKLDAEDDLK